MYLLPESDKLGVTMDVNAVLGLIAERYITATPAVKSQMATLARQVMNYAELDETERTDAVAFFLRRTGPISASLVR